MNNNIFFLFEALHLLMLVTTVMSGHWLNKTQRVSEASVVKHSLLSAFSSLKCKSDGVSCLEALFPLWALEHIAGHL